MKFEVGGLESGVDVHHGAVELVQTGSDLGGFGSLIGKLIGAYGRHDKASENSKAEQHSQRAKAKNEAERSSGGRHEGSSLTWSYYKPQPIRHETVIFGQAIPRAPWGSSRVGHMSRTVIRRPADRRFSAPLPVPIERTRP
ncbi:unannotated protein [freshwater metagenome]|uniref:Unannotated protein n=1 Tax=freshwater metagenome TaxID=449393 RepID=A0A6J7VJP1_9ZZZZ